MNLLSNFISASTKINISHLELFAHRFLALPGHQFACDNIFRSKSLS